jgi:hypothetical protein
MDEMGAGQEIALKKPSINSPWTSWWTLLLLSTTNTTTYTLSRRITPVPRDRPIEIGVQTLRDGAVELRQ